MPAGQESRCFTFVTRASPAPSFRHDHHREPAEATEKVRGTQRRRRRCQSRHRRNDVSDNLLEMTPERKRSIQERAYRLWEESGGPRDAIWSSGNGPANSSGWRKVGPLAPFVSAP